MKEKTVNPKVAVVMKYITFFLGCGLVLAGLTSIFYNPTQDQILYSALSLIIGALFVSLSLTSTKKFGKGTFVNPPYKSYDTHSEFHSPTDAMNEDEKNG